MRDDGSAEPHPTKVRPDARDLAALCPRSRPVPLGGGAHFARRALVIRGLMAGSLDAADAVLLTRPAAELLGLLVPIDGLAEQYLGAGSPPGWRSRRAISRPAGAHCSRWSPGSWTGGSARTRSCGSRRSRAPAPGAARCPP
ncbi:hypothetical protein ACFQ9X_45550 [Catenulispora yoronensis]